MLNTIIALLVSKKLLNETEGEQLADKILHATLPADYKTAARQLQQFLDEIEKGRY